MQSTEGLFKNATGTSGAPCREFTSYGDGDQHRLPPLVHATPFEEEKAEIESISDTRPANGNESQKNAGSPSNQLNGSSSMSTITMSLDNHGRSQNKGESNKTPKVSHFQVESKNMANNYPQSPSYQSNSMKEPVPKPPALDVARFARNDPEKGEERETPALLSGHFPSEAPREARNEEAKLDDENINDNRKSTSDQTSSSEARNHGVVDQTKGDYSNDSTHCFKNIVILVLIIVVIGLSVTVASDSAGDDELRANDSPSSSEGFGTLDIIQERGNLRCGVPNDQPGFAVKNAETGDFEGMDVDLVRREYSSCLHPSLSLRRMQSQP